MDKRSRENRIIEVINVILIALSVIIISSIIIGILDAKATEVRNDISTRIHGDGEWLCCHVTEKK
jgi:hypothetical protein